MKVKEIECRVIDAENGIVELPKTLWEGETHWELVLGGKTVLLGKIIPPKRKRRKRVTKTH